MIVEPPEDWFPDVDAYMIELPAGAIPLASN
jgi:hypothetical protein